LAHNRTEYVQFPYLLTTKVTVFDPEGMPVPVDFVPLAGSSTLGKAVFQVYMPPMGYSMYIFKVTKKMPNEQNTIIQSSKGKAQDRMIENHMYQLIFSNTTGKLISIKNKQSGASTSLDQTWGWYNSSDGNVKKKQNRGQASGAYIFRPNCTENIVKACDPFVVGNGHAVLTMTKGKLVQKARQVFADWLVQEIFLYSDADHIEVEFTVGPIPFKDNLGKEVISVWRTDIASKQIFYTDSNGRDMQKRIINHRPTWTLKVTDPVSGNFYPVNHAISINDTNRQLNIMTDRSQSGASLQNGEIQLMVHRRTLYDDHRGVSEPLNETGASGPKGKYGLGLVVTGLQRVTFDVPRNSAALHRFNQDKLTFPPHFHFTPYRGEISDWIQAHNMVYSGLSGELPVNVHLLSAYDNHIYGASGTMILRLAHQFEVGKDDVFSKPATVDLGALFSHVKLTSCVEMSLTANQKAVDVNRYKWKTEKDFSSSNKNVTNSTSNSSIIIINPMQIKTFQCKYAPI